MAVIPRRVKYDIVESWAKREAEGESEKDKKRERRAKSPAPLSACSVAVSVGTRVIYCPTRARCTSDGSPSEANAFSALNVWAGAARRRMINERTITIVP